MAFTGKVVALVGVTLASGVVTWAFSPIKFQADMGILLTFMFLWNMLGALVLIPALSHVLLGNEHRHGTSAVPAQRSEERRVGKSVSVRVDLGGRRIIKKKKHQQAETQLFITFRRNKYVNIAY